MKEYGEGDTDKVRLRIQVEALKQDWIWQPLKL